MQRSIEVTVRNHEDNCRKCVKAYGTRIHLDALSKDTPQNAMDKRRAPSREKSKKKLTRSHMN